MSDLVMKELCDVAVGERLAIVDPVTNVIEFRKVTDRQVDFDNWYTTLTLQALTTSDTDKTVRLFDSLRVLVSDE